MTKLKPCPFCGSHDLDGTCSETGSRGKFYYVFCNRCEASGPTSYFQDKAKETWNERAKVEDQ